MGNNTEEGPSYMVVTLSMEITKHCHLIKDMLIFSDGGWVERCPPLNTQLRSSKSCSSELIHQSMFLNQSSRTFTFALLQ